MACADPDTPCVPCGDNTYAPIPGTRGQCPLCSEVPNSGTIRDADVRPAPAISPLLFRLLRAAGVALGAYLRVAGVVAQRVYAMRARGLPDRLQYGPGGVTSPGRRVRIGKAFAGVVDLQEHRFYRASR